MKIIRTKSSLKKFIKDKKIGFVPTMGSLHEGHISLIKKSLKQNPFTLVSIFVNPKQFGHNEDYLTYPRVFEKDKEILSQLNIDAVFYPDVKVMYGHLESPQEILHTYVGYQKLENLYCGQYRPGFFNGIMFVVLKLLNLVKPMRIYLGKKDYQQYYLIKKMVKDIDLDVQVIGLPIVRGSGGLALSSRNQYLSHNEMVVAENIYRLLKRSKFWVASGRVFSSHTLKRKMMSEFKKQKILQIQYIEVVDKKTLLRSEKLKNVVILVAGFVNQVRLIDNIEIN